MELVEKQKTYSASLTAISEYFKKYCIEDGNIEKLKTGIENFSVVTPVIGAFSSGKSSLLNMLIEQNILPVQITPETSIATELNYSKDTICQAVFNNNRRKISIDEIKNNDFTISNTDLLTVKIPSPVLEDIPNVTLVDIPGLDSGVEAHNKAIDNYLDKSLAYIVTVDAEQGLKESIINFLKELNILDMPVLVVLTKCDKKTPEDVEAIYNDVKKKVEQILGLNKYEIVKASARLKVGEQIKNYLRTIQTRACEIFSEAYTSRINENIKIVKNYVSARIDKNDFSLEDIEEQERLIAKQLDDILGKIEKEKIKFSQQIDRAIISIEGKIRAGLEGAADSFVNDIIAKRDIKQQINSIIRMAVAQGIKSEIEPKTQNYFRNIAELMDVNVTGSMEISVDPVKAQMDTMLKETIKKSLPLALAAMGFAVAGPIAGIVLGVISVITEIIFTKKKAEEERSMAIQKVRGEIIPSVSNEACAAARSNIMAYVDEINQSIEKTLIRDKELKEKALEDLKQQKALKKEEQDKTISEMKEDLKNIEKLFV